MVAIHNKNNLRYKAKTLLKTIDLQKAAELIIPRITQHKIWQKANNILLYYPLSDEINLLNLLEDKNKNFYLPVIREREFYFAEYQNPDNLIMSSKWNILEPNTLYVPMQNNYEILDLILIPALAYDQKGYRLGRGSAYYDRLLSTPSLSAYTIGIIPSQLYWSEDLPIDIWDVPVNEIITPKV